MTRRFMSLVTGGLVLSLALAGCSSDIDQGPQQIELPAGDKQVEILGSFSGDEATLFEAALVDVEQRTGVDITYTPAPNFNQEMSDRIAAGNLPDIALYPEPNLLLSQKTSMVALDDIVNLPALQDTLVPGMDALARDAQGKTWGLPIRANIKSVVWYSQKAFKAHGYTAPTTDAELSALVKKIKADGGTPWCLGVESGSSTGWTATDWIEDYVLRMSGAEDYRMWAAGEILFHSDLFNQAALKFKSVWDPADNVAGGAQAVASTSFATVDDGMFTSNPNCYLMRQGSFFTGFLPLNVQENMDSEVGVFPLPATEGGTQGVVGRAELAAAFTKDADVQAVLNRMLSDLFGGTWAKAGGWLSPHITFDGRKYPNETVRSIAAILYSAQVFVYDASDLMPENVGNGAFTQSVTKWIKGEMTLDQMTAAIDAAWAAS